MRFARLHSYYDMIHQKGAPLLSFLQREWAEWMEFLSALPAKLRDLPRTNYELGLFHMRHHNWLDARLRFYMATRLNPRMTEAYFNLARCYIVAGNQKKALAALAKAIAQNPNDEDALFLQQSLQRDGPLPTHIPLTLVHDYFNHMADRYDEMMLAAHYTAPSALMIALKPYLPSLAPAPRALDIGCGTGMMGVELMDYIRPTSLVGIDISAAMLHKAGQCQYVHRPIYHTLLPLSIANFLEQSSDEFDLITACYSLHFNNNLGASLRALLARLAKGGILALVVAATPNEQSGISDDYMHFQLSETDIEKAIKQPRTTLLHKARLHVTSSEEGWVIVIQKK